MRKSFWSVLVASILIVLLIAPSPAWSWGNTGHQAVAFVAWNLLDQPTKDKIFALLKQVPTRTTSAKKTIAGFTEWSQGLPDGLTEDQQHMYIFMRASTWADSIKHVGLSDSDTPPAKSGDSNIGFSDKFSHGYWHFEDTAFGTAATAHSKPPTVPKSCWVSVKGTKVPPTPVKALPKTPVPDAVTEITLLSAALASGEADPLKAYDMIWLEHLVGDIHQPLHASARYVKGVGDEGGNCVDITITHLSPDNRANFKSSNPKASPPNELHAFWDDLPGVGTALETQKAADYAAALPAPDSSLAAIADVNTWAKESFVMAKKDAYATPIGPALGRPTSYQITDDYYTAAAADAKARIALAGARLAALLTADLK